MAVISEQKSALKLVRKILAADCDPMWQMGIDVPPEYRQHGIGKAVVSALTSNLFPRGILPYYSTAISNLASRQLAISIGYRPAWVEVYAADISTVNRRLLANS